MLMRFACLLLMSLPLLAQETKENILDMGKVILGQDATQTFDIVNPYDQPLHFTGYSSDCQCIEAKYPDELPAKGKGKLTLTIHTTKLPVAGQQRRFALHTDNPEHPAIPFGVKVFVDSYIVITPEKKIPFNKIRGETQIQEARVFCMKKDIDFSIDIENPYSFLRITKSLLPPDQRSKDTRFNDKQYHLVFEALEDTPLGYHEFPLTLKTNIPEQPELPLTIVLYSRDKIYVTPRKLDFRKVQAGHPTDASRFFYLMDFKLDPKEEPIEITELTSDVPFLKLEKHYLKTRSRWMIIAKIPKEAPKGKFKGVVRLKTNAKNERYQQFEVPVYGEITGVFKGKRPNLKPGIGMVPPETPKKPPIPVKPNTKEE